MRFERRGWEFKSLRVRQPFGPTRRCRFIMSWDFERYKDSVKE